MRRLGVIVFAAIALLAFSRARKVTLTTEGGLGRWVFRRIALLVVGVAAVVYALDRAGLPAEVQLVAMLALLWATGLARWAGSELGVDVPGPWPIPDDAGARAAIATNAADCPQGTLCLSLDGGVIDRTGLTDAQRSAARLDG